MRSVFIYLANRYI